MKFNLWVMVILCNHVSPTDVVFKLFSGKDNRTSFAYGEYHVSASANTRETSQETGWLFWIRTVPRQMWKHWSGSLLSCWD